MIVQIKRKSISTNYSDVFISIYISIILNRVHNLCNLFISCIVHVYTSNILEVGIVVKGVQVDQSSIKQILVVIL